MRQIYAFLLLAFAGVATSVNLESNKRLDRFGKWASQFRIAFRDGTHYDHVYETWVENDDFIERVNGQNKSYTLGHNHMSGMNSIEFREFLWRGRLELLEKPTFFSERPLETTIPESVNWVSAGGVTPVKDQGQCGSCWSFSTTGALESAFFNKVGTLKSFSEQQLVDCDNRSNGGKDKGCNGGLMDNAFTWIGKNNGLCAETEYPYVSGVSKTAGTCQKTCENISGSKVSKFVDVSPSEDNAMMSALVKQTVSIAIEADQKEFQLYKSGVFSGACGTNLDHGVLAVGYGTLSGNDYYLVKNSWGTSWGDGGYIRLGRGRNPETGETYNKGDGQCGMLLQASYPVL